MNMFGYFAALVLGFISGVCLAQSHWEKETVRHGVADYSQTTGQWQWKAQP